MANKKTEIITFGAGCFWHVQAAFDKLKGVTKTTVGYMGGTTQNPSYEEVCTDKTGHVEVCQVEFDPLVISLEKVLQAFWQMHDPTQLNRQGPDIGSQYRSVIFFHKKKQQELAEQSKRDLIESAKYKDQIMTEILPAQTFFKAEDYHQKYFVKTGKKVC